MSTTTEPAPAFVVGQTAVMVAGIEGVVDAIDHENVTINGVVLPRRLDPDRGIKYLSMFWPEECTDDHAGQISDLRLEVRELEAGDREARAWQRRVQAAVSAEHDAHHFGSQRFCDHQICREVSA